MFPAIPCRAGQLFLVPECRPAHFLTAAYLHLSALTVELEAFLDLGKVATFPDPRRRFAEVGLASTKCFSK